MAIIWTVEPGDIEVEVFNRGSEWVSIVPFGYDSETEETISVFVAVAPQPQGDHEHVFCIVRADQYSDEEQQVWSGLSTKELFPSPDDRAMVLGLICAVTAAVLQEANVRKVFHCTHDDNPPEKALNKHIAIMKVFRDLGYTGGRADSYHGHHIWIMERQH